jgi:hypothetical protein
MVLRAMQRSPGDHDCLEQSQQSEAWWTKSEHVEHMATLAEIEAAAMSIMSDRMAGTYESTPPTDVRTSPWIPVIVASYAFAIDLDRWLSDSSSDHLRSSSSPSIRPPWSIPRNG